MSTANGRKDHFIPAGLLGRFSAASSGPSRDRPIAVVKPGGAAYMSTASDVGHAIGLYDLGGADLDDPFTSIDPAWTKIETNLPAALERLKNDPEIDARVWLRILVPHFASLFVRGAEFGPRFVDRFKAAGWTSDVIPSAFENPNINGGRLMELQRLLAPAMCTRWIVFHLPEGARAINNDLGLAPHMKVDALGWLMPIDSSTVVLVIPTPGGEVVRFRKGRWWKPIEHADISDQDAAGVNEIVARLASEFIIGDSIATVDRYTEALNQDAPAGPMMEGLWPSSSSLRAMEHEWYRAVSLVGASKPSESLDPINDIDPIVLNRGWVSPMFFVPVPDPGQESNQSTRLKIVDHALILDPTGL